MLHHDEDPKDNDQETGCSIDISQDKPYSYDELSRRDIRSLIFHLLYTMDALDYQESLPAVIQAYQLGFDIIVPLDSEAFVTTQAIIDKREELDNLYRPLLTNWRFDRIGVSTKLILRFSIWELLHTNIDHRIVMNEAVELAKCFGEKDSFRFINGILDKIAQSKNA